MGEKWIASKDEHLPFFLFMAREWLGYTLGLTDRAELALLRCMVYAHCNSVDFVSLPLDREAVARGIRYPVEEWNVVERELARFFRYEADRIVIIQLEARASDRAAKVSSGRRGGLASARRRSTRSQISKTPTKVSRQQPKAVAEAKKPRDLEAERPRSQDSDFHTLEEPRGMTHDAEKESAAQYVDWGDVHTFWRLDSHGPALQSKLDSIFAAHRQSRESPEATLRSLTNTVREWKEGQGGRQASE